ncbi:MAG TPA: plasmid partition protein ParG [Gemmataceae bacterium]|jgi:hypothetical protein
MKKVTFGGKPTSGRIANSPDEWVSGEPTKRLTIDIPLSLHQRVKSQCALEGANMAEVVRGLLEKRFPPKDQVTAAASDPVNKGPGNTNL